MSHRPEYILTTNIFIFYLVTTNTMKIEITNGYVMIKDKANRGAVKAFKTTVLEGVEVDVTGKNKDGSKGMENVPFKQTEDAVDRVVFCMLEKIVIDEKVVEITEQAIEDLDNEDFSKIGTECIAKVTEAMTEKKTSKTK